VPVITVSDGVGVGVAVGCAPGVDFGAELDGGGVALLLAESATVGAGGAGDGDDCELAAESRVATVAESAALVFAPVHAEPNVSPAVSATESRRRLIESSPPTPA
jgi:hypothetical protein